MLICPAMPVELPPDAENVPIQDAATLLLLRDGARGGLETFMVRRNQRTAFGPGDYVFPGGAVDAADCDPALYARCAGLDDAQASARMSVAENGLAAWIAAIRECFEEAGVLLAEPQQGGLDELRPALDTARAALHARKTLLAEVCASHGLRLRTDALVYYSHWITPLGPPRRYSTRFFAARLPPAQTAEHDGVETVAGEWITPARALARHADGDFPMILPTVSQLRLFRECANTEQALARVAAIRNVPTVAPHLARDADGHIIPVIGR